MKTQLAAILSMGATISFAQPNLGSLNLLTSGNQQLIEEAVKNSFVILHTTYQLEDSKTKERFNVKGNSSYFGESYSLAVRTPEGYLAEESALRPWQFDNNFEYYREEANFQPVLLLSEYRLFSDTAYTDQTETFKPEMAKSIVLNKLYALTDKKFDNKGLYAKALTGKNEGWLVWVLADSPLMKNSNAKLSLLVSRQDLIVEKNKMLFDIPNPKTDKTVLGGIYVVPEVTDVGEIALRLLGMLQEENEKWQLILIVNENSKLIVPTIGKASVNTKQKPELEKAPKNDDNPKNNKPPKK